MLSVVPPVAWPVPCGKEVALPSPTTTSPGAFILGYTHWDHGKYFFAALASTFFAHSVRFHQEPRLPDTAPVSSCCASIPSRRSLPPTILRRAAHSSPVCWLIHSRRHAVIETRLLCTRRCTTFARRPVHANLSCRRWHWQHQQRSVLSAGADSMRTSIAYEAEPSCRGPQRFYVCYDLGAN